MVRTRLLGVQSAAAMLQSRLITKQTESGELVLISRQPKRWSWPFLIQFCWGPMRLYV